MTFKDMIECLSRVKFALKKQGYAPVQDYFTISIPIFVKKWLSKRYGIEYDNDFRSHTYGWENWRCSAIWDGESRLIVVSYRYTGSEPTFWEANKYDDVEIKEMMQEFNYWVRKEKKIT